MTFKNIGCIFNEETKEKIYEIYIGSNLEVLEYVHKLIPDSDYVEEALHKYLKLDQFDDEDECVDIFWGTMDYIGMADYILNRDKEL